MDLKRLYRGARLAHKIFEARLIKKRMPINVYFLVTNRCNLKCFFCYPKVFDRDIEDLPTEKIFAIIDELVEFGTRYIILEGGEPLLRQDIGEIIDYVKFKGVVCELITNGFMIKKRLEAIRRLDSLCISIEGEEKANDLIRGDGTYRKTMEGINVALNSKISIRLHATLTRYNYHSLDYLAKLAKKAQATLTISQPSIHMEHEALKFSDDELRNFWRMVRQYKQRGYPIGTSFSTLDYVINWPFSYNHILRQGTSVENFKPIQCSLGRLSCNVDANGMVYPCSILFHKYGLNMLEKGIRKAWDYFKELDCVSCGHVNQVEQSEIFSGNIKNIYNSARYFLKPKRKVNV